MAEAFPQHEEINDCPICLEKLKKAETLPCHHSFCEDCLSIFRKREAEDTDGNINCPVCRKPTGSGKSENESDSQSKRNTRQQSILCAPCLRKEHTKTPAIVLCQECTIPMCMTCEKNHDFFLLNHSKVKLEISLEFKADFTLDINSSRCMQHGLLRDMYCCDDNVVVCSKCAVLNHRDCSSVLDAKVEADRIKTVETDSDLKKLHTLEQSLDETIGFNKKALSLLKEEEAETKKLIIQRQETMNRHFKLFHDQLGKIVENEEKKLYTAIGKCTEMKRKIGETKTRTDTLMKYGNACYIIKCSEQMKNDIRSFQNDTLLLSNNTDFHISFEFDNVIPGRVVHQSLQPGEKMKSGLQNIKFNVPRCTSDPFLVTMTTDTDSVYTCYSGILVHDEENIILCDRINNKIQMFGINTLSVLKFEIEFKNAVQSVWEICRINAVEIAVTHPTDQKVSIITVKENSFEIKSTINIGKNVYGIDHHVDKIFVTCPDQKPSPTIEVWSRHGAYLRRIESGPFSSKMWHLRILKTKSNVVIAVTQDKYSALLMHLSGSIFRVIEHPSLSCGNGVDFDDDGNLYVCGTDSSCILQVKTNNDYAENRILTKDNVFIRQPLGICVYKNTIYVSERNKPEIKIIGMMLK